MKNMIKIKGIKKETVEIEISENELMEKFSEMVEKKLGIVSNRHSWYYIDDDGNLVHGWEEHGGSHGWDEKEILRKATKLEKRYFKLRSFLSDFKEHCEKLKKEQ